MGMYIVIYMLYDQGKCICIGRLTILVKTTKNSTRFFYNSFEIFFGIFHVTRTQNKHSYRSILLIVIIEVVFRRARENRKSCQLQWPTTRSTLLLREKVFADDIKN